MTGQTRREREFSPNVRSDSQRANFAEDFNIYAELFTLSGIYLFFSAENLTKILFSVAGYVLFPLAALVSIAHFVFAWIRFGHGHRGMVNRNWGNWSNALFQTAKGVPLGVGIIGNLIAKPFGYFGFGAALPWIFFATLSSTALYCLGKIALSVFQIFRIKDQIKEAQKALNRAGTEEERVLAQTKISQLQAMRLRYLTDIKYCFIGFMVTGTLSVAVVFVNFVPGIAAFVLAGMAAVVTFAAGAYLVYEFIKNRRNLSRTEKIGPKFKQALANPATPENSIEMEERAGPQVPLLLVQEEAQIPRMTKVAKQPSTHWLDYHSSADHVDFMSRNCRTKEERRDYVIQALCEKLAYLAPLTKNHDLVIELSRYCRTYKVTACDDQTQNNKDDVQRLETALVGYLNDPVKEYKPGFALFKFEKQAEKHQAKFRVCMWMLQTLCGNKKTSFQQEHRDTKTGYNQNKALDDSPLRHVISEDLLTANAEHLQKTKTLCVQSFFRNKADTQDLMEAAEFYHHPERFPHLPEHKLAYARAVAAPAA